MKSMAFAAPLFMLAYGVLRWIDGLDGHHHKGSLAWNAGHVAFLASMVTFALLAIALYRRATLGRRTALVAAAVAVFGRSEEHTSELQSRRDLVCRLLLEKK